jgi:hypothetical protein
VPPDVDAPVAVAVKPGTEAVDRGLERTGAAEHDDELVDRALGARSLPLVPDHVDLLAQGLVKHGDLVKPAVVVRIVLIVARVNREPERAVWAGTGHSAPPTLWPHLYENFTTVRVFSRCPFSGQATFTVQCQELTWH